MYNVVEKVEDILKFHGIWSVWEYSPLSMTHVNTNVKFLSIPDKELILDCKTGFVYTKDKAIEHEKHWLQGKEKYLVYKLEYQLY